MAGSDPARGGVHIRDVEDSDVEVFFEHQRDPVAILMASFPARERDAFFAHWGRILTDRAVLAQTIVVDGEVAGNVVSWDWDQAGTREVGYWIGRAYWGRGVATRALALFLGRMTSRPVYAYVAAHNLGSIRVLEKCGFHRTPAPDVQPHAPDPGEVEEVELVLKPEPEATGPRPPSRTARCLSPQDPKTHGGRQRGAAASCLTRIDPLQVEASPPDQIC